MAEKSRVLVIGSTGSIGKFIVEASVKFGHPTFALVRESSLSDPAKANIAEGFKSLGVNLLYGDVNDQESLLTAIKQVDVVISAVAQQQVAIQDRIVAAIKAAGNIKRFLPSEFGNDADHHHAVEPAKTVYATKAKIRRLVEAEGIPYTHVVSNAFSGYHLSNLSQLGATAPPRDKVVIFGDGNAKVVFNTEDDIGTYTIKAIDDPRTLNKIMYIRPPANTISMNELVSLWERKIGKTLERVYVPEEGVLKNIQEAAFPQNVILAVLHSVFVKGDQANFEIKPSFGVEASELYPDVKYTTVDQYMDQFI
ncbi:phenylcoumaran benzylic ether reductase Pyrc5 isoform X1 [Eucalyptus grandis]|uniref:phenylcoumaran benzylic ether reductase Pyrc5 isoform X1 n=1 Tax=Eucalyptus grandis TaxID=71139 RepID=UPI00192E9C14|nr:phenylcoumaran benzylic ether reductase Pyrc5 isoform X1 [Eucalyptus grandis]